LKRGDIVSYWRKRGGKARGIWQDESRTTRDKRTGLDEHEVKIRPIAPEGAAATWIPIENVYDEEREEA